MNENNMPRLSELNPVCLIRRLVRELPAIFAVGLIAAMLALTGLQVFYRPEYTAGATVAVNMKNAGFSTIYSNLAATSEIAGTLTELFGSQTFMSLAQKQTGGDRLNGKLSASVIPETNLLRLSVTSNDPSDAFRALRFLLDNYDAVSEHVFQNVILRELDAPTVPTAPSNPTDKSEIVKKAFLAGAAAMTLAVLAVAAFSDTVQTGEAVRRRIDARLFATIHHEKKHKTLRSRFRRRSGLLITMPTASFYFTEEFGKLASKVSHAAAKNGEKVLLVTSVAEHEGKSTVAANLALALAQNGKRVLLIDADLHKPTQAKLFDVKPTQELAELLRDTDGYEPQHLPQNELWGLFSTQEQPEASELLTGGGMERLLERAKEDMDIIVVDSPPVAIFTDAEALADIAGLSLLVVKQDCVPAGRINDAVDMLEQCDAHFIGCVFNDARRLVLPWGRGGYGYGYGYRYGYGYGRGYGYGYGGKRAEDGHGREKD